ncbi:MAG: 30S ribosomal protein S24e [Candidatus Bathyarchaeia archaeon]|nr:30S ribosomal protein S24e [Candidatus Bathyarchaeota archaeon]
MKIKILSNKRNELLKRNEIIFRLSHDGLPTPSRIEVKKELANMLKVDSEAVFVRRIESITGTMMAVGEAHIYDSQAYAKEIEPEHIIIRNSPQIKREE